jgi:hypothetical protein
MNENSEMRPRNVKLSRREYIQRAAAAAGGAIGGVVGLEAGRRLSKELGIGPDGRASRNETDLAEDAIATVVRRIGNLFSGSALIGKENGGRGIVVKCIPTENNRAVWEFLKGALDIQAGSQIFGRLFFDGVSSASLATLTVHLGTPGDSVSMLLQNPND